MNVVANKWPENKFISMEQPRRSVDKPLLRCHFNLISASELVEIPKYFFSLSSSIIRIIHII